MSEGASSDNPVAADYHIRFIRFDVPSGYDPSTHRFHFPDQVKVGTIEVTDISFQGARVSLTSNHRIQDFDNVRGDEVLFPGLCPEVKYSICVPLMPTWRRELSGMVDALFRALPAASEHESLDGSGICILEVKHRGECRSMLMVNEGVQSDEVKGDSASRPVHEWISLYAVIWKLFRDPNTT